jgi:hypothetical protein
MLARILVAAILLGSTACGPSAKEVETARAAHYQPPAVRIFDIAETVTKQTFKIADADPEQGLLLTLPKWYGPDGQSENAGVGDAVIVQDGSLLVALLVKVEEDVDGVVTVTVTPIVERFRLGQSQHEKVPPDDASMPGWVHGKADSLLVAIHARAKEYAK